jgi:carbamoyl-phosphate synthase large subunit
MTSDVNVLISSVGRRVGLLKCVRDSIERRGCGGEVLVIDSGTSAPAMFVAAHAMRVPHCVTPEFIPAVLQLCAGQQISLLIPTIDTELPTYAAARAHLSKIGTSVCISDPGTIDICCNKIKTHAWLIANNFPAVRQTDICSAFRDPAEWPLPLIAKPYNGSASLGVHRIHTRREFEAILESNDQCIVQEIAPGREFTINVFVNEAGECICEVPHWRMEVRWGEVSKGRTVKDRRLMGLARAVAEALPGARGPLNIQCFMDDAGSIRIIEINARFGGGYPLAHQAGARFTDWLLDEREGKYIERCDDWRDDLAMLRYDEAIFVPGSRIEAWNSLSAPYSTSMTHCSLSEIMSAAGSQRSGNG